MTAEELANLIGEQDYHTIRAAFAMLYQDGIVLNGKVINDFISLAMKKTFKPSADGNLFISHKTLRKLLNISKKDIRKVFNANHIKIKNIRFLTDDLQINSVYNVFDNIDLVNQITGYMKVVNDFVKINKEKDNERTKGIFYNAKKKWINRLISNGFLYGWRYEKDDKNGNSYYALSFKIKDNMYYFHQPICNIDYIKTDYSDLEDKDNGNEYRHHYIDKENNILVSDTVLRDNLLLLFRYIAYTNNI